MPLIRAVFNDKIMLKIFLLSLIFLFSLELTFNRSVQAQITQDVPVCYLETQTGQQINLTHLCGQISPKPTASSCSGKVTAAALPLTNVNFDGKTLTGQIKNQSCQTLKYIKVNYEVQDQSGNVIDNGFIYAEPLILKPGEIASFQGAVTPGKVVKPTYLDWQQE